MQPDARRRGASPLVFVVAVVSVSAVVTLLLAWTSSRGGGGNERSELYTVQRGDFAVTIPVSGELAALNQITVRNPLETRAAITYIVNEGVTVKAGDVLFRLAQDELEERIKTAELDVLSAQNSLTAAENALAILLSENESELSNARLQVELAELQLRQWEEGDVVRTRQNLQLEREKAERNLLRLTDKFEGSQRLFDEGFISKDEYELDRIAMIQAEADLKTALLDIEIYENYTFKREQAEFTRELQNAEEDLERIIRRHEADVARKQSDVDRARGELDIRTDRLRNLKDQLEKCVVRAPTDGLVVYTTSLDSGGHRGNDEQPPQVGTELPPRREVIILPDTSTMLARVKVNEALSGQISLGLRATVFSDSMPDKPLSGQVIRVGVLAESGGWRDPNRRDYTVDIRLEGTAGLDLKPSMRCKAEIFVDRVNDSLSVPIQAVFRRGALAFVYMPDGAGYSERAVDLGRTSELRVEILAGLSEGDRVLLREPREAEVVSRLPSKKAAPANAESATVTAADDVVTPDDRRRIRQDADGQG